MQSLFLNWKVNGNRMNVFTKGFNKLVTKRDKAAQLSVLTLAVVEISIMFTFRIFFVSDFKKTHSTYHIYL